MIHAIPQGDAFFLAVFCPACMRLVSRENGVCVYRVEEGNKPTEVGFIHRDCRLRLTDASDKYKFFSIDTFFSAVQEALNPEQVRNANKMLNVD